ncbi:hypothetical protein N8T08_006260 [Aspergillus melleus]|uniref:Uncharacterized protein n=1 Tax=Aspergillus melleus TaxID=138277 RepID=A0ACC3B0V0_9EURO|nr:hypothetical protein N8T08_006260 [Aspergillus melleus]
MTAPPVPPKTSASIIPAGPASFGAFTPSDWEHLSPQPGNVDDEGVFGSKQNTVAHAPTTSNYPPSYATAAVPNPASQSTAPTPPSGVSPTIQPTYSQDTTGMQDQFRVSPVSPGAGQDTIHDLAPPPPLPPPPPPPIRAKTDDSLYSSASATEASESIDGVIEAWKQPLPLESTSPNVQIDSHASAGSSTPLRQLTPLDIPQSKQEAFIHREATPAHFENTLSGRDVLPQPSSPNPKQIDPYEDLDPWSKSSLDRYVAMLRKEAVADSDTERFKIFTAFMAKETKLREILYNVDSTEDTAQAPTPATQPPIQKLSPVIDPMDSGLIPVETEEVEDSSSDTPEEPEDGKYSPGGRPILPRLHTPKITSVRRSASNPGGPKYGPERLVQGQFSRSTSVPPTNDSIHKQEHSPLATKPPQPIYTPFSYTEGPQRGSDQLSFHLPAYQAYSALRQASATSGRIMSNAPNPPSEDTASPTVPSSATQNQDDETFIGLIREKSVAYRKHARKSSSPPPLPLSLRQGRPESVIDDLRSIISSPLAKQSESPWHKTTREGLKSYSNDFKFIMETMKFWETASQSRKEALDKERLHRQEESEKHIDALFNDKEIGYADINVLEEEFRQTEARVQLEEERREFEDFEAKVFKKLDERLNDELSALRTQYESALGQLDHENSRIKDSVTDKYNLSHTMKVVNEIYQKLEVRYQKRLEIALDLERRRKKTERRPLVFMGDSAALKRLDSDFDEMERRNVLEAAKDRDERANRLMDSFDDAIMHGLGENQSLLDELSAKLSKVDAAVISASKLADSEIEQMFNSVYNMVESLREDSESILHSFGIVDSALNNADYQVSVAEARYSNADVDIFRQLENEKKKEDTKIQSELQTKLESVRAGPAKITTTINDLLEIIDKDPIAEQSSSSGTATPSHPAESLMPGLPPSAVAPRKSGEETAHQERLRKALEDAKKRNAARRNP